MPDMQQALKELQESVIVLNGIESRHAELLKDHTEWLHTHTLAVARHDEEIAEDRRRGREIDERIDRLVAESREIDERIDRLVAEGRERGRNLDERIGKLVSAMGEFLRKDGK